MTPWGHFCVLGSGHGAGSHGLEAEGPWDMDPEGQSWEQQSRAFASTAQLPWVPWIWSEARKLFRASLGLEAKALPYLEFEAIGSPSWAT